jgi:hypothetical protein
MFKEEISISLRVFKGLYPKGFKGWDHRLNG